MQSLQNISAHEYKDLANLSKHLETGHDYRTRLNDQYVWCLENMLTDKCQVRENHNNCDKLFEKFFAKGNEYCDEMTHINKHLLYSNETYKENRFSTVQQLHKEMEKIVENVDQFACEYKLHLDNATSSAVAYVNTKKEQDEKVMKGLQGELYELTLHLSGMHRVSERFSETSNKTLIEIEKSTDNILLTVENKVWDKLKKQYANLRANCLENVKEIKQNELQPYQSTGMTPSKREFKYPRALEKKHKKQHLESAAKEQ